MNVFDLLIALAATGAAVGGYRLGFVTRATAWTGMCLGVLVAARAVPTLADHFGRLDPNRTLLISAITLLTGAFIGQLAGQAVGRWIRAKPSVDRGDKVDRVAGAALGVLLVMGAVWLLTPAMESVTDWPARLVGGSLLARKIDELTPDPPDPVTAASKLVGERQWASLSRELAGGLPDGPIPDIDDPPAAIDAATRAAVVLVQHRVCGQGPQVGTGFVAAPHLVVTNAHVVAGTSDSPIRVQDEAGRWHDARLVHFDPSTDLAVLRVESITASPLPLADASETGSTGWVYGHPKGRGLQVRAFRAGVESDAEVPDIYDEARPTRRIVPIRAALQQGDSGSPLIDGSGAVVGVAFAVAPDDDPLAVAIAMREVQDAVDFAQRRGADAPAQPTGPCMPVREAD